MSLEENKALVRRWIEAYNQRNLDLFDEFIAPDYVDHTNKVDKEGLRQLFTMGFTGFPRARSMLTQHLELCGYYSDNIRIAIQNKLTEITINRFFPVCEKRQQKSDSGFFY